MKTIRIMFLHPSAKTEDDIRRLLRFDEREHDYLFKLDSDNPDYVFGSEHIYYDERFMKLFCDQLMRGSIKVFYAGECICADLNVFDYAILFDKKMRLNDRIGRMPTVLFFLGTICPEMRRVTTEKSPERRNFCNFIYSNANAHPFRDELFNIVNSYKKVDSLGKHLNNTEISLSDRCLDWREESIKIKSHYKFSIAAENAKYDGYTSEKIIHSFLAGTIPIYWGSSLVKEEFNEKSFIYIDERENIEDIISKIKMIDEDSGAYLNMLNEPWMTKEQMAGLEADANKYYSFLLNIFGQDIISAKRVGKGTAPGFYQKWFKGEQIFG